VGIRTPPPNPLPAGGEGEQDDVMPDLTVNEWMLELVPNEYPVEVAQLETAYDFLIAALHEGDDEKRRQLIKLATHHRSKWHETKWRRDE
jgi:hypothetical protein